MENIEIEKKVKDIIEEISGERPTIEQNLRTDLNIDSLEKVEIVMAIEKEFDFDVEDSSFDDLQTVKHLIDLITITLNERDKSN